MERIMNPSSFIFDTVINFVGYYFVLRFFHIFLTEANVSKAKKYGIPIGAWVILWLINTFANNANLNTLSSIALYLVIVHFLYHGTMLKKILTVISTSVLAAICEGLVWFFASNFPFLPQNYTLGSTLSTLMYILLALILERYYDLKGDFSLPFRIYLVFILMLIGNFFLCDMMVNESLQSESMTMIALSILCLFNLLIYYILNQTNNIYQNLLRKQSARKQHELYLNQLKLFRESRDRIHAMHHDLKNHCLSLSQFIQKDEREKALDYLSTMIQEMAPVDARVNSGNLTLDAILNHFLQRASLLECVIETKISVPSDTFISDFDLNIILGNLLENALEALEKAENPKVRVTVVHNTGLLYIEVRNTFNGNLRRRGGHFLTTKEQRKFHGHGINNIRNVVEKYDGVSSFFVEGDEFVANISLYIQLNKNQTA